MFRSPQEELFLDGIRHIAVGKMTSTMLELVLELDVFGKLRGKSVTLEEFARLLEMPLPSARMLAQFLCVEGLLVYRDKRLSNAPATDPFMIDDNILLYEVKNLLLKYNMPLEKLKHQLFNPVEEHGYQRMKKESHYISSNAFRILWGEELANRYSFKGHRVLIDVAGATGAICLGIRKTNPHLRCIVFDLPESEEFAQRCIDEAQQGEYIRFVGGSFFDGLPRGADVAVLSNVVHNWPWEQDKTILTNIYDALEPGGTLVVKEFFFEDDWTGSIEAVFQAFFMGKDGWQPDFSEGEELMREAGFVDLERKLTLLIGRKPV
jgi:ubiquinone/menaquinone biosynthesis C-methylase UbiE